MGAATGSGCICIGSIGVGASVAVVMQSGRLWRRNAGNAERCIASTSLASSDATHHGRGVVVAAML